MMRTILIAVVLVVSVYFILRELLNRFLVRKILASSLTLANLKYFEKQKDNIQVLFFGSCEFKSGIDPKQFSYNAFNFSVPLISYVEQYYFLYHYINQMPSLKALILSVGDNSFCSYASTGINFPMAFNRFINYKELAAISKPNMRIKLLWYKWLYSSYIGHIHYGRKFFIRNLQHFFRRQKHRFSIPNIKRFFRQRILGKEPLNAKKTLPQEKHSLKRPKVISDVSQSREVDTSPLQKKQFANEEDGRIGATKHFSRPVFDKRGIIYFEKILSLCKDRHIPVMTVTMPRSKYFLKFSEEEGYITEAELMKKIIKNPKYKNLICEHLNYLSLYRDKDEFFTPEGAELNKDGSYAFSARLAEDLSSIIESQKK